MQLNIATPKGSTISRRNKEQMLNDDSEVFKSEG